MVLLSLLLVLAVAIAALVASLTHSVDQGSHEPPAWQPLEQGTTWSSVALAALAAAGLLVVPVYEALTVSGPAGITVTQRYGETLLSVNGLAALPPVLLPVLLAAIPLFRGTARQRRVRAAMMAVLLVGFTILGGFSIGLFFVPSALAMLAVAILGVVNERTA